MNILPKIKEEGLIIIDQVILTSENENITIQYIEDGWDLDYDKTSCSTLDITSCFFYPQLIEWQHNHKHIQQIKLCGKFNTAKEMINNGTCSNNHFIWNISCNMFIDELRCENDDGSIDMNLVLRGDMW